MVTWNPVNKEEVRVVNIFTPVVPYFGVYYSLEEDKISLKPVMYFVVREFLRKSGDFSSEIKTFPVIGSAMNDMVEETEITTSSGFIGLTTDHDEKNKSPWSDIIRDIKKKNKGK